MYCIGVERFIVRHCCTSETHGSPAQMKSRGYAVSSLHSLLHHKFVACLHCCKIFTCGLMSQFPPRPTRIDEALCSCIMFTSVTFTPEEFCSNGIIGCEMRDAVTWLALVLCLADRIFHITCRLVHSIYIKTTMRTTCCLPYHIHNSGIPHFSQCKS